MPKMLAVFYLSSATMPSDQESCLWEVSIVLAPLVFKSPRATIATFHRLLLAPGYTTAHGGRTHLCHHL